MASIPKHLIVYAEDDADDRELMREAFEKYHHSVELVMFADGASILRYLNRITLSQHHPCLIVLDINLPFFSGQEVFTKLRDIPDFAHTPVIFFSTSSQQRDQVFADMNGAGFITKPLTYRQMNDITERMIDACEHGIQGQIRKSTI